MARITVEDCLEHVENRFSLVLIAAERTKQILKGAETRVDHADNKEVVTALREIAEGYIKYHEKDPEEIPPEVAAAEVRKAVQMRQIPVERPEPVRPPPTLPMATDADDEDIDDSDLDNFDDEFPEEDED
jgi:DNA-directed RNA polymerase subunit omega